MTKDQVATNADSGSALGPLSLVIGHGRSRLVAVVVTLVWLVLAGRLVQIQSLRRDELLARVDRQRVRVETIPARPGDIVDRHGRLFATTVTARSVFLDPERVGEPWEVAQRLGQTLGVDPDRLFVRLSDAQEKRRRFLWVKRRVNAEEVTAVQALALPDGAVGFREEYLRQYPQGRVAVHVLGLRDVDGIGRGGVEQHCDELLRGRDGQRRLVRDARGRVVEVREEVTEAPVPGRTVVLTIDSVLQLDVERELDRVVAEWHPRGVAAVVLDPRTGEMLATASRPNFDPNDPVDVPVAAWRNNVLASVYEPGSTVKPLVVATAVEQGLLERDEVLDCENGVYRMGRRLLHDHHAYGLLSVTDVLVKSSNIGMAKVGERLTNAGLHHAVQKWGFGRKTGVDLPGEVDGLVRPLAKWDGYSTGSVPMGHEFAVTPLQLAVAHAALANGGQRLTPRVVLADVDALTVSTDTAEANGSRPAVASRIVEDTVARWLVEGPLREVVRRGTGRRGQVAGYAVFGKTGTAQKFDPATGQVSPTLHVTSFVCGAPASDPQVLVVVVVDEPEAEPDQGGGTVAAPTAAAILKQTLVHLRIAP